MKVFPCFAAMQLGVAGGFTTHVPWQDKDDRSATYTIDEFQVLSAHFVNFLREQGIGPGDCVAALLLHNGRIASLSGHILSQQVLHSLVQNSRRVKEEVENW